MIQLNHWYNYNAKELFDLTALLYCLGIIKSHIYCGAVLWCALNVKIKTNKHPRYTVTIA